MNDIQLEVAKAFLMRFWMLSGRCFTFGVLCFAQYKTPHLVFIIAAIISLPLVFIALYRVVETARLYTKIKPDIDRLQTEIANENYRNKLGKK
jgi:hypothetical protein